MFRYGQKDKIQESYRVIFDIRSDQLAEFATISQIVFYR